MILYFTEIREGHSGRMSLNCWPFQANAACFIFLERNSGIPWFTKHWLRQDVSTRWNSTLYILESTVEQNWHLLLNAMTFHSCQDINYPSQTVITILKPVEDINQSVSSGRASASMLISFVRTQRGSWESNDDHGIQTMKMKMLYLLVQWCWK